MLSKRQVITCLAISQSAEGFTSIFDALCPFFEPVLQQSHGQIYNPKHFVTRIAELYGWGLNEDIAEDLVPTFEQRGWLKRVSGRDSGPSAYIVNLPPLEVEQEKIADIYQNIQYKLLKFINDISPLSRYSLEPDSIVEILVSWLIAVDGYDGNRLIAVASQLTNDHKNGAARNFSSEQIYLCARFVQEMHDKDAATFNALTRIAELGMVAEIALEFQQPTNIESNTDLTVVLDAPVMMAMLGLSGINRKKSILDITDELRRIGCRLSTFNHCCEEIKDNLASVLGTHPSDRYGPTGDALRSGELTDAFAQGVRARPKHFVKQLGVSIIEQRLDDFPNQFKYFTKEMHDNFYLRINWLESSIPRERDSLSNTLIMRRRQGVRTDNIWRSKFVFLSSNPIFATMARKFCIENNLIEKGEVEPIIHRRRLASILWLSTGMPAQKRKISHAQLLEACSFVLASKQEIFNAAKKALTRIDAQQIEQLELLLSLPRSTQILMDRTLGASSVITQENVTQLLEAMRQTVAEDIREQAEKEIALARRKSDEVKQRVLTREAQAIDEMNEAKDKLEAAIAAVVNLIQIDVRRRMRKEKEVRKWAKVSTMLIGICTISAAMLNEIVVSDYSIISIVSIAFGIFFLTIGFTPLWPKIVEKISSKMLGSPRSIVLEKILVKYGIKHLGIDLEVDWEKQEVKWKSISGGHSISDSLLF